MYEPNPVDPYIRFNKQTGLFEPVQWLAQVMPFWLYADAQFTSGAQVVNAAGTVTPPFIYKLPHASISLDQSQGNSLGNPLLINQIVFEDSTDTTALANFTVMLKDMGDQTQFMNQPIHIRNFAGTGQLAAGLSEPLFMPTRHNMVATFDKISGGAVNMRMFFLGQIHYTWATALMHYPLDKAIMMARVNKYLERRKYIYPFWLTSETPVVCAANQTVEVDALIGDDGHFEATDILKVATSDQFEVEMFNPLTKQTYMNGPIQGSGAIGNAQNPQPLPVPIIIPAGQRLRFKFKDLSGSQNRIAICLRGRKLRSKLVEWNDVKAALADLAIKPVHQEYAEAAR